MSMLSNELVQLITLLKNAFPLDTIQRHRPLANTVNRHRTLLANVKGNGALAALELLIIDTKLLEFLHHVLEVSRSRSIILLIISIRRWGSFCVAGHFSWICWFKSCFTLYLYWCIIWSNFLKINVKNKKFLNVKK